MHIAPGLQIADKYLVEQPLARGGMGSVWVARHIALNALVAIKFLDAHYSSLPGLLTRFEREARAASALDTPHVVQIRDYGVDQGTPYLVMELLRGEDLGARLKRERRLPLHAIQGILAQMAKALRKAHQAGIVHRDLKPANIFLARVDDEEVVKVLDFGIAKDTGAPVGDATKSGEVFGSPHYMSPEQARAEKTLDARSDLWSVGVILYRATTGSLPFPGDAIGEILSCIFVDAPPRPSTIVPGLPPALDAFFERALAKRKEQRFQTIAELVESFTAIAAVSHDRGSLAIQTALPAAVRSPAAPAPFAPAPEPSAAGWPAADSPGIPPARPPYPSVSASVFQPAPPAARPPLPSSSSFDVGVPASTAASTVGKTLPLVVAPPGHEAFDTFGTQGGASRTTHTEAAGRGRILPILGVGLAFALALTVTGVFWALRSGEPGDGGLLAPGASAAPPADLRAMATEPHPSVTPAPVIAASSALAASGPSVPAPVASAPEPSSAVGGTPAAAASGAAPVKSPASSGPSSRGVTVPVAPVPSRSSASPGAASSSPTKKPDKWGLPD